MRLKYDINYDDITMTSLYNQYYNRFLRTHLLQLYPTILYLVFYNNRTLSEIELAYFNTYLNTNNTL